MPKKERYWAWLIAYIDSDTVHLVKKELARYLEYREVEVIIPTVKVLKKTFKGENQFVDVPLLFQYGFFKIPRKYAMSELYLDNMQANISCIFGWLKDPHKIATDATRVKKKIKDKDIPVATCTSIEVAELVKKAQDFSIYSADDLEALRPGSFITLRGYPFDGLDAEVVEVNFKKKSAKVRIHLISQDREVDVAFDNIFFTIYQGEGYNDELSNNESLDELMSNRNRKLHKKYPNEDVE